MCVVWFFFFKQKTAYEMRISDWSSDVCSSDLRLVDRPVIGIDRFGIFGAVAILELRAFERNQPARRRFGRRIAMLSDRKQCLLDRFTNAVEIGVRILNDETFHLVGTLGKNAKSDGAAVDRKSVV